MISQFRDKKSIRKRRQIVRTLVFVAIFIIIFISGFIVWMGGFFHQISIPFWRAKNTISETASGSLYLISSKKNVFNENQILRDENTRLKTEMTNYELLVRENEDLKSLLGRLPEKSSFLLSSILSRPNQSPYDTVIVDVGLDHGVRESEKVYVDGKLPVGVVSAVYEKTSIINLYSNPGQATQALLEGANISVSLLGRGGGNFEMSIPVDVPSLRGSAVVLPGISSEVVAVVEEIISSPTDPLKKVLLRSPVNIQTVKWLEIKK